MQISSLMHVNRDSTEVLQEVSVHLRPLHWPFEVFEDMLAAFDLFWLFERLTSLISLITGALVVKVAVLPGAPTSSSFF